MPSIPPLVASGSREMKRPRSVPKLVREAIKLMVFGLPDDPDGKPIDFVTAGRRVGLKSFVLRRYFDRAEVRSLLRSERRAFRKMINSGNELALRRVRDTSENGMAVIGAVRGLEDLDAADVVQTRNQGQTPGVVIVITAPRENTLPEPVPVAAIEHAPPADAEPVFDPNRPVFDSDR